MATSKRLILGWVLGIAWFGVWLLCGTWLLLYLQRTVPYWVGLLLPLYFLGWVASLFLGRAGIGGFASAIAKVLTKE
jgi:hypothetical protein